MLIEVFVRQTPEGLLQNIVETRQIEKHQEEQKLQGLTVR
jgi:hypothetical protein